MHPEQYEKLRRSAEQPQLFTVEETLSILSICRATLYSLINDGHLKALKIRHATRVRGSDLLAFVDGLPTVQKSGGSE